MLIGVVAFVVAIVISVCLHEAGHMATAKAFGMKVTRYFLGFGPTLWSFRRGETEYGVKAIPAGGFVNIVGQTDLEEVPPEDADRAMVNKPGWQRFAVLGAGSFTHFVLAIIAFVAVFALYPVPSGQVKVVDVARCLGAKAGGHCQQTAPAYGELHAGDTVVAVDGTRLEGGPNQLSSIIQQAHGEPVTLKMRRGGQAVTRTVDPREHDSRYIVGIHIAGTVEHLPPGAAVQRSFATFGQAIAQTGQALAALPSHVGDMMPWNGGGSSKSRVVSVVGIGQLSGGAYAQSGLQGLLVVIAIFNIGIGIFNLLPLLPLDGGHMAVVVFERGRALVYRLVRRPDPGRVDYNKLLPVTVVFLGLIVFVAVVALVNDIVNPVTASF
ncbi:MAG: M50 family metallopeptidase [Streptosporangiaceae bacterium]